ncbi:glycerol dehydrogenase-like oxidoreductase [Candidatus Methanoperedens nitroreducens]|uniref:Glycerol-1-phosphate dehydrogenase [NAD(P)+] n=1 Tax=Candidatus Methanoperedens nitratireducens TaxID=1392998 RepID=A0A062VEI4_9EURY|nr:NAD(P)-dependent glycerol-1-phosphate dehydrogenase [Candidatus Methanoperedens nitroreducens]KCZ73610.1 glycerol dehydrogenase-like oxidoreductase [Candidatus Methanoperedens nitroreducens]MDJ1422428.1 NAD(P)-dependent glycerol-1-phosphate dehydrogenase [Candidatus Methanoperedens sp.]
MKENKESYKNKWMQLPRNVVVGHDVISDTGKVCKDLKLNGNALIVAGESTLKAAGKTVEACLEEYGFNVDIAVVRSPAYDEVKRVEELSTEIKASFLLGVGGGKSIDIAKLASTYLDLPFISIPTAASHDGIVSSRASILKDNRTVSEAASTPIAVIADTAIIAAAPYRLLIAGCGDIISNYTAVRDWELAHRLRNEPFSEYASIISKMTAKVLIESARMIRPGIEESAWTVIKALVASGVAMSIAGSSRPASGSEHKFSHALDEIAPQPALHGEQCGVGTIMMMYLHGGNWQEIRDSLITIGAPSCAVELGIGEEYIIQALLNAHEIRPERYTILGTGLTREAAEKVARITKVI